MIRIRMLKVKPPLRASEGTEGSLQIGEALG